MKTNFFSSNPEEGDAFERDAAFRLRCTMTHWRHVLITSKVLLIKYFFDWHFDKRKWYKSVEPHGSIKANA